MTHSLISPGYHLVALLFEGVIVSPYASSIGVCKAIQELRPKYGARVTRIDPRRSEEDAESEAALVSREAGFGLRTPHWAAGCIDVPRRRVVVVAAPTSRQCALPNLRGRPRRLRSERAPYSADTTKGPGRWGGVLRLTRESQLIWPDVAQRRPQFRPPRQVDATEEARPISACAKEWVQCRST